MHDLFLFSLAAGTKHLCHDIVKGTTVIGGYLVLDFALLPALGFTPGMVANTAKAGTFAAGIEKYQSMGPISNAIWNLGPNYLLLRGVEKLYVAIDPYVDIFADNVCQKLYAVYYSKDYRMRTTAGHING